MPEFSAIRCTGSMERPGPPGVDRRPHRGPQPGGDQADGGQRRRVADHVRDPHAGLESCGDGVEAAHHAAHHAGRGGDAAGKLLALGGVAPLDAAVDGVQEACRVP